MPDLSLLEKGILVDLLIFYSDKPRNIGERLQTHPNTASGLLTDLSKKGLVSKRGQAVYELTDSGRETARELLLSGFNPYLEREKELDDEG